MIERSGASTHSIHTVVSVIMSVLQPGLEATNDTGDARRWFCRYLYITNTSPIAVQHDRIALYTIQSTDALTLDVTDADQLLIYKRGLFLNARGSGDLDSPLSICTLKRLWDIWQFHHLWKFRLGVSTELFLDPDRFRCYLSDEPDGRPASGTMAGCHPDSDAVSWQLVTIQ